MTIGNPDLDATVIDIVVSTLLEILARPPYPDIKYPYIIVFQPFLRFWVL